MIVTIASRNSHKVEEIRAIFKGAGVEWKSAADWPDLPDPVEDGETFEANALIKARALAEATRGWALGDDSGLEVAALDGAPGILSARYAGVHGDNAANNRKLLAALKALGKVTPVERAAQFRCVMALVAPDGRHWIAEGLCRGHILDELSGTGGFGYDPLFVPVGYTESFAALGEAVKNRISHRANALARLRQILDSIPEFRT